MLSTPQPRARPKAAAPHGKPLLTKVLNLALWPLPFARRWIAGTISNRYGRAGRLRDEGKRQEAFDLAVQTTRYCLGGTGFRAAANRLFFWLLMTHASELVDSFEQQQQVLELLLRAPGPGGIQEATVLDEISRWSWRRGEAAQAVEVARTAVKAAPEWSWGHLTLAFYLQHSKLGDPLPVLIDAVRADPACIPDIENQFDATVVSALRASLPQA